MGAGQLETARAEIQKCLEDIRKENAKGVHPDPLTVQLVSDLNESLRGLADQHTWSTSGEMRMQSKMYSHARQRCYESSLVASQTNIYAGTSKKARTLQFSLAGPKSF